MCHDFARKIPVLKQWMNWRQKPGHLFLTFSPLHRYTTHLACSAGGFIGRENVLLAKAPWWNSKREEEMGRVKRSGEGAGSRQGEREEKTKRGLYQNKVNLSLTFTRNQMPYTHVWKRVHFDAFKPSVHTNTRSVFIKNASILKRSWKRIKTKTHTHHISLDSRKRFKTVVWTRNDRCVFHDNENALVWTG